jgi:hypothetical protein
MRNAVERFFGTMLEIVEDGCLLRFVVCGAEGADFVLPILCYTNGGEDEER